MKGSLVSRIEAEIDAIADDSTSLSTEQRRIGDERGRAEMLVLERIEDALIESAPPGATIYRRQGADLRAVLGLADDLPGYQQD